MARANLIAMISIIICSRSAEMAQAVSENIKQTIGNIPYELIIIDNSIKKEGICKVYNDGLKQSKYSVICFMHEDVEFKSLEWGNTVIRLMDTPNIGLLGLLGSTYSAITPSTWVNEEKLNRVNVFYHEKHLYTNPYNEVLAPVKLLDGVWLCGKREVFCNCLFDETTFGKFHYYDLDISLQISQLFQNYVTYEIDIVHNSYGNKDEKWLLESIKFYEKWKSKLPLLTGSRLSVRSEYDHLKLFVSLLLHYKFLDKNAEAIMKKILKFRFLPILGFCFFNRELTVFMLDWLISHTNRHQLND